MQGRVIFHLAVALGAAVCSGALAAAPANTRSGQSGAVNLVAADQLVGRSVESAEGERIGKLRFVTIDLDRGTLSHLIVDTTGTEFASGATSSSAPGETAGQGQTGTRVASQGQTASQTGGQVKTVKRPEGLSGAGQGQSAGSSAPKSDGHLLIVPFDVATVEPQGGQVIIAATAQLISSAPRLSRSEFNKLTEPAEATYVIKYWAPASEVASLEGQNRNQPEPQSPGATGRSQAQSQAPQAPVQQTRQPAAPSGGQQRAPQSAPPVAQQSPQGAGGASAASGGNGNQPHHLALVGRELVAEVTPPMFQLGQSLRGAAVVDRQGHDLGAVRQIMVDADTGDAAFAIVAGGPAGQVPVPLQALDWTTKGTLLTADPGAFKADPALTQDPQKVSRDALGQLYRRFDTAPYWQNDGNGNGGASQ